MHIAMILGGVVVGSILLAANANAQDGTDETSRCGQNRGPRNVEKRAILSIGASDVAGIALSRYNGDMDAIEEAEPTINMAG